MSVQKIEFTDANFGTETREGLSVVCFGDPRDIECKKQVEIIEKAAHEITGQVKIGKCDIDNCFALAERFQVTSIPTTIIFKSGKEVERLVGYRHEVTLVKHLKKDVGEDV